MNWHGYRDEKYTTSTYVKTTTKNLQIGALPVFQETTRKNRSVLPQQCLQLLHIVLCNVLPVVLVLGGVIKQSSNERILISISCTINLNKFFTGTFGFKYIVSALTEPTQCYMDGYWRPKAYGSVTYALCLPLFLVKAGTLLTTQEDPLIWLYSLTTLSSLVQRLM